MDKNNGSKSALALGALVACLPALAQGTGWQAEDRVAWTRAVETSDGAEARLEVRCEPEPVVRLLYPVLAKVPEAYYPLRPHWHRIVRVTGGWGLDLRRPDHQGAVTYWLRCVATPGCLRARDTEWIVSGAAPPPTPIDMECGLLTLSPRRVSRCRRLNAVPAPIGIG